MKKGSLVITTEDMTADWPDRFPVPKDSQGEIVQVEDSQPDVVRVRFENGDLVWVRTAILRDNPSATGDTEG